MELALEYIGIMRISLVPIGLFFVIQGFFGAINQTSYIMWSGIISNVLNIGLNYLFIFGELGFPKMGIGGAALGLVLSLVLAFFFLVFVIFKHLRSRLQKDIVAVALAPAIQNIIALAIFMIYQTLIEDYSPILLAATHTAFAYFRLNKTIIGGFARSAGILVGNALGRSDKKDAQAIMNSSGKIAAIVALAIALLTFVGRDLIAGFFSNSTETQQAISQALLFFIPFFFVEAIGYAFEMVFITNGYGKYVLFSEFSTNILFILGASLLARFLFPHDIHYAWISFGLYQIFHAGLMVLGFFRRKWLHSQVEKAVEDPVKEEKLKNSKENLESEIPAE